MLFATEYKLLQFRRKGNTIQKCSFCEVIFFFPFSIRNLSDDFENFAEKYAGFAPVFKNIINEEIPQRFRNERVF